MLTRQRVMAFVAWLGALDEVADTPAARKTLYAFLKRNTSLTEGRIDEIRRKKNARWKKANSWDELVHPLLGLHLGDRGIERTEIPRHLPRETRELLDRMQTRQLEDLANAWEDYLRFHSDDPPSPLRHAIFGSLKVPSKQYDIVVWAHSDQKGGTELACTVALALRAKAGRLTIAVATPVPAYVTARYREELSEDVIETPTLMHPKKRRDGGVDPEGTYDAFKSLFMKYPLEAICAALVEALRTAVKPGETLFVSCGEPLAMAVAAAYGCKSIIVSDHLITDTLRRVLQSGGYFNDKGVATLLDDIKDLYGKAAIAYLPPQELSSSGRLDYLSELGVRPMTLRGLFYETPTDEELHASEGYRELARNLIDDVPLVCVFGGGGETWSETLQVIDDLCRQGKPRNFSLLIQSDPSSFQALWHLFSPEARNPIALRSPARMLHWYALTDLVVGRGGLVAQQVLACAYGVTKRSPHLLFVEDPGHPLIEDERRRLSQNRLVTTVELRPFRESPLSAIQRALDWLKVNRAAYVRNVRLRYGPAVLSDLAAVIVEEYFPEAVTARFHDVGTTRASNNAKAFSGVKVLVTGSHGFIGRSLVEELRRLNAQVIEYDLKNGRDVLNRWQLLEMASGADVTFHLAGASSVTHFEKDFESSWETTIEGLANVLEVCGGRIVFPSTASIYDDSSEPAAETVVPPEPINEYAKAKRLCELRCHSSTKDVRVVRIFSGYGPGDRDKGDAASPVAKFLQAAETGGNAEIYGDGQQARDFVFVDDIVKGLIAVALSEAPCRVCNIGTGKRTTFLDLITLIKEIAKLKSFDYRKREGPLGYVKSVVANTQRAEREFGFRATVDLNDGLRRTIRADFPGLKLQ